ncbi:MAG: hypothetical protein IGBAC_1669 [Ignavibacteriae bacterium]|nr:MAG: hypothetical protein IGBAC_1669 [Ignavibacteriota bacterium]
MDYQQTGAEIKVAVEQKELEAEINNLWDKIKKASELIFLLREENQQLKEQNSSLVQKLEELKEKLTNKEQEIGKIKAEYARVMNSAAGDVFTPQEKEALRKRIHELIAKINSHL